MGQIQGRKWFSTAAQDPDKNQEIVEIIRKYFQKNRQALDDTAENLTGLICRNKVKGIEVWSVLFDLAKDVPTTHSSIVDLLKEILLWSDGTHSKEALSKLRSGFHMEWRETQADLRAKAARMKTTREPAVMLWINFNVFTSYCISAGIIDPSWGLEHVVVALETDIEKMEMPPFREVALFIAGKYLINCADCFLQHTLQDNKDDETCNPGWGWDSEVRPMNEGVTQERLRYWCVKLLNLRQYGNVPLELAGASMYATMMVAEAVRYSSW